MFITCSYLVNSLRSQPVSPLTWDVCRSYKTEHPNVTVALLVLPTQLEGFNLGQRHQARGQGWPGFFSFNGTIFEGILGGLFCLIGLYCRISGEKRCLELNHQLTRHQLTRHDSSLYHVPTPTVPSATEQGGVR